MYARTLLPLIVARAAARSLQGSRSRTASRVLCVLTVGCAASACEDERSGGEDVAARPALTQVGSAEGPFLDEDVACEAIRAVLVDARDSLDCDDIAVPQCPDLIRPGGTIACTRFTERSVDGCLETTTEYQSCSDFSRRRCLLVSALDERTAGCVLPGTLDGGADAGDAGSDAGGDAGSDGGAEAGAEAGLNEAGAPEAGASEAGAPEVAPPEGTAALDAGAAAPTVMEGDDVGPPDASISDLPAAPGAGDGRGIPQVEVPSEAGPSDAATAAAP